LDELKKVFEMVTTLAEAAVPIPIAAVIATRFTDKNFAETMCHPPSGDTVRPFPSGRPILKDVPGPLFPVTDAVGKLLDGTGG
jgi:hypothetical protein